MIYSSQNRRLWINLVDSCGHYSIVLEEDPPRAVSCHSEIGFERILFGPVFDLSEAVFRLIEPFVEWFSLD